MPVLSPRGFVAPPPSVPAPAGEVLNFVLVGELRSGTAMVQSALARAGAVCHLDLFHPSVDARRACHESYFGKARDAGQPDWYVRGVTHPVHYINARVLDTPLNGERVVGLRLHYDAVRDLELFDLFRTRDREGSFCLVHVVRNPVSCFVSLKQAERTGRWFRHANQAPPSYLPSPFPIDPDELTAFVRTSDSTRGKVAAACTDAMTVDYADLSHHFTHTLRKVFDFLGLDPTARPMTEYVRLRNRPIRERVSNFERLAQQVPPDVRRHLDPDTLY